MRAGKRKVAVKSPRRPHRSSSHAGSDDAEPKAEGTSPEAGEPAGDKAEVQQGQAGGFVNYYEVLNVRRDATSEDIRQAFRKLAKKYHPDLNADREKWADEKFCVIIQAYDTLMNRDLRTAYDRRLRQELDPNEDGYRQTLREKSGDPRADAKLILEDFLHERGEEALRLYESLCERDPSFDLGKYLDIKDYLDVLFLIGEEYERIGDWRKALEYYHKVYDLESVHHKRFFLDTLKERIRDIYCKKLARRSTPIDAVHIYEMVLELGIPKKTEAYIQKKIAEAFFRAGQDKKAKAHLAKAFALEPRLKGAQKICEKLGLDIRKVSARATEA
jgi:tetratricopeptide (TPR) repeat protein